MPDGASDASRNPTCAISEGDPASFAAETVEEGHRQVG